MAVTLKVNKGVLKYAKSLGYTGESDRAQIRKFLYQQIAAGKTTVKKIAAASEGDGDKPAPANKADKGGDAKPAKKTLTIDRITNAIIKKLGAATGANDPPETDPAKALKKKQKGSGNAAINKLFGGTGSSDVKLIGVDEQYRKEKRLQVFPKFVGGASGERGELHPMGGQTASFMGRDLETASDLEKAAIGAWLKFVCTKNSTPGLASAIGKMTEHDKHLVNYAIHELPFVGRSKSAYGVGPVNRRKLNEVERKALLDDTVSGGIEIAPAVFDDAIISYPVLFGQLFPYVKVREVKGRRVKGGSIQNPPFTSGTPEGSPIEPFDTSSFIRAFDTPVHPAVSYVEIGRDFSEDTPVNFGAYLLEGFGKKALEWLDRVIAIGNGTNEPLGFLNTIGIGSVSATFPNAGPLTPEDFENLMFAVTPEYRFEPGANVAFVSNDTMYKKARQIPRSVNDRQRLFGMDHQSYKLLDAPYRIQQGISTGTVGWANLQRYRMYKRLEMLVRIEEGGRYNAINNTIVMVVRMRWGGQMEVAGACAKMVNGDQS